MVLWCCYFHCSQNMRPLDWMRWPVVKSNKIAIQPCELTPQHLMQLLVENEDKNNYKSLGSPTSLTCNCLSCSTEESTSSLLRRVTYNARQGISWQCNPICCIKTGLPVASSTSPPTIWWINSSKFYPSTTKGIFLTGLTPTEVD